MQAGIMIGIACIVSNKVGGWQGAFAFSLGLIVIVIMGFDLYTGKVGYEHNLVKLCGYIFRNLAGILLISMVAPIDTSLIAETKLSVPLGIVFLKAIGCGFLMYIAVEIFKKRNSIIGCVTCVPAFILCGFEHSIADMFYLCNAQLQWRSLWFILIVIIGNGIGANLHRIGEYK